MSLHTLRVLLFVFKRLTVDVATEYKWLIGIAAKCTSLYYWVLCKIVWHLDTELLNIINISDVI